MVLSALAREQCTVGSCAHRARRSQCERGQQLGNGTVEPVGNGAVIFLQEVKSMKMFAAQVEPG